MKPAKIILSIILFVLLTILFMVICVAFPIAIIYLIFGDTLFSPILIIAWLVWVIRFAFKIFEGVKV